MFRGMFEGWHLIILVVLLAILFGSKRLPDAARGLGRSLRILKAEVKEMREEDVRRPGASPAPAAPEPIEGRLADPETPRRPAPSEQRNDL